MTEFAKVVIVVRHLPLLHLSHLHVALGPFELCILYRLLPIIRIGFPNIEVPYIASKTMRYI